MWNFRKNHLLSAIKLSEFFQNSKLSSLWLFSKIEHFRKFPVKHENWTSYSNGKASKTQTYRWFRNTQFHKFLKFCIQLWHSSFSHSKWSTSLGIFKIHLYLHVWFFHIFKFLNLWTFTLPIRIQFSCFSGKSPKHLTIKKGHGGKRLVFRNYICRIYPDFLKLKMFIGWY